MRIRLLAYGLLVASASLGPLANPSIAVDASWTFTPGLRILNASSIELVPSDATGTADVSAIKLPDGRIRAYFGVINGSTPSGIKSAISSDGKTFTVEPGDRIPAQPSGQVIIGAASPFAYQLADGRVRLYMVRNDGVMSATSDDGLTFTFDAGMRLTQTAFQPENKTHARLFCSAIVPLTDSRYRMYCTQGVREKQIGNATLVDRAIFSAVSTNLLDWTPEPGVRIGLGSGTLNDGDHPAVLSSSPSGAVTLLYDRRAGDASEWRVWGEFISVSDDGLTFTSETYTGIQGTEPSYIAMSSSTGYLLYGNHSPESGSTISISSATLAVSQVQQTPKAQVLEKPRRSIICVKAGKIRTFAQVKCPSGWRVKK